MGDEAGMPLGRICWTDLTVPDAERTRRFYEEVVGWEGRPEEMDGYSDYHMVPPGGTESAAGICHARGVNSDLPPQWLVYITVADVDASAAICRELGGEVVVGPRPMGGGRFCVIRDPAGAVCALYRP